MMAMMMNTNFSEIKKQKRNKAFKIWGWGGSWGRNKGFWPEYLPLIMILVYTEIVLQTA